MTQRTLLSILLTLTAAFNARWMPGTTDAAVAPMNSETKLNQGEAQIDWLRSRGGYFNPKLELRRIDNSDDDSPIGVFASQDIPEKETLMVLPQNCLLKAGPDSDDLCDLTRTLMHQRELGEESEFAPYVHYLLDGDTYKGHLPASWSDEGKELLTTIIGRELYPTRATESSFEEDCGGSGSSEEGEEIYLLVVRRSWDDTMVPLYDMFNHRNDPWTNVYSNSIHEGKDVTAFASRAVKAGEEMYISYNECVDCKEFSLSYGLPHMVRDFGFVEQYPRRWLFPTEDPYEDIVMELDEQPGTDRLKLTWLSEEPDEFEMNFFRGHLRRLRDLGDFVTSSAAGMASDHERSLCMEFYDALLTALEYAIQESGHEEEECVISADGDVSCADDESRLYDDLEEPGIGHYTEEVCSTLYSHWEYEEWDGTESQFQTIDYKYSKEHDDTCLALNGHLQACSSFRPHYHEVFVHYPARFVDEVKRIAFIGGGDNMIVHEILKYPSLELAVGLELDHNVVRSSFKNFGTQPHWDDERLQWWYGDASKSLLMLPQEYYGTFDIVLLDLQTEVAEILKVTEELNIMAAALLLLKKDGVIARNEDWEWGTANAFTDYAVDLYYIDVPLLCKQGITVGSNTVDLLRKTPKDHGIDTLYLPPLNEEENQFGIWYNYVSNSSHSHKLCRAPDVELKSLGEAAIGGFGVLMILEAEDAEYLKNASPSSLKNSLSAALKNAGLDELSVMQSPSKEGAVDELVFVLREGFAVARTWPGGDYCAFDLLLWSSIEKQEVAKKHLVTAVGSTSPSSYRIITGGMFGASPKKGNVAVGPQITDVCEPLPDSARGALPEQSEVDSLLEESCLLIKEENTRVVALCGEQSSSCSSLDLLAKTFETNGLGQKVFPVWTCPSVVAGSESSADSSRRMLKCESDTLRRLDELVTSDGKIGAIVIDPKAPLAMGQIIHKILSRKGLRLDLLEEDHAVLAISLDSSESWHRALLDRFRADLVKFDPAYRAEVVFNGTGTGLELGVFSSGDAHFYSHLVDVIARIETKTGLIGEVRRIMNGLMTYVADFEPSVTFSHQDYDSTLPLQQWMSQQPMGEQELIQFSIIPETRLTAAIFKNAVQSVLVAVEGMSAQSSDAQVVPIGDGCVVVGFSSHGSAIATWDGRTGISVYLFAYTEEDDGGERAENFAGGLVKAIPGLTATSHDGWPRGMNRVVNYPWDIDDETPHWAHS